MKPKKNVQERISNNLIKAAPGSALVQQNNELRNKVEELQHLLNQSKNNNQVNREEVLKQLRTELEREQTGFLVDIRDLKASDQCRQTITPKLIREKALSLLENSQRKKIILMPLDEQGKYEIEDGELTWRAATELVEEGHLKWQKIEAVLSNNPNQNEDAHRRSLIHHLHSAGLNNLDRSVALLRELKKEVTINLTDQEIAKAGGVRDAALNYRLKQIICSLVNKLRRIPEFKKLYEELHLIPTSDRTKILEKADYLNPIDRQVLNFFYSWQVDNLETFYRSVLPTAFMNDYLKNAVRKKGLNCSLALILDKIQDKKQMQKLTSAAIKHKWSKSELKQEIAKLCPKEDKTPVKRYQTCIKSLKNLTSSDLAAYSDAEKIQLIELLQAKLDSVTQSLEKTQ